MPLILESDIENGQTATKPVPSWEPISDTTVESEKKSGSKSIGRILLEGIAHPFLKTAASARGTVEGLLGLTSAGLLAAGGKKEAAKKELRETEKRASAPIDAGIFGTVGPAKNLREGIGTGAELAATVMGGGTASQVGKGLVKAGLRQTAKVGLKEGAKVGALAGFGTSMQEEDATPLSVAKGTIGGAAGGAVLGAAIPATGLAVGGVLRGTKELVGLSTGIGSKNLSKLYETMAKGTEEEVQRAYQALRGNSVTTLEGVVERAKMGLTQLRLRKGQEYVSKLDALTERGAKKKTVLDLEDLATGLKGTLDDFNIRLKEDGSLDFVRSTIANNKEGQVTQNLVKDVMSWGNDPQDATLRGIDTLKKRIDDYYSPFAKEGEVIRQRIKSVVLDKLNKATNGKYATMSKAYEEATNLQQEIERALSLGSKATTDVAIRKLSTIMRNNNDFRRELLNSLYKEIGEDLSVDIAGAAASEYIPRGLTGRVGGAIGTGSVVAGGNFGLLPLLAASSPRIVGEFVSGAGLTRRALGAFIKRMRGLAPEKIPALLKAIESKNKKGLKVDTVETPSIGQSTRIGE